MLRVAIQSKGRLSDDSLALLKDAGIKVDEQKRKFLAKSANFPLEILYLRDDDIPGVVADGSADIGIVGFNEVAESGLLAESCGQEDDAPYGSVKLERKLGFGSCRISLAIPKDQEYTGPSFFEGRSIATSYPAILAGWLKENGVRAEIRKILGSVEIAPAASIADAIFDIVSSGGTLVSNGLKEVEKVIFSEAVLISGPSMNEEKKAILSSILFRFDAISNSAGKKYILMNLPSASVEEAVRILPAMRSPTVMPLAAEGWCSLHSVVLESELWDKVERLKAIGAEGILVLDLDKIIL